MIKKGVSLYGVRPEMAIIDNVVQDIFRRHSIRCRRTSVVRDYSRGRSLHPVGFGIDYGTRHIMGQRRIETIEMIVEDLKDALPECDIVLEYIGKEQEHIHIEFDPKEDATFQAHKKIYRETGQWPE